MGFRQASFRYTDKCTRWIHTLLLAVINAFLASCPPSSNDLAFCELLWKAHTKNLHVAEPHAMEASYATARKELVKINCERHRRMPVSPPPPFHPEQRCHTILCFHRAVIQNSSARILKAGFSPSLTQGTAQSIWHRVHIVCTAFLSTVFSKWQKLL